VTKIIKIAAFLVVCIFNKEFSLLLKILEVMGIKIGPQQKYSIRKIRLQAAA